MYSQVGVCGRGHAYLRRQALRSSYESRAIHLGVLEVQPWTQTWCESKYCAVGVPSGNEIDDYVHQFFNLPEDWDADETYHDQFQALRLVCRVLFGFASESLPLFYHAFTLPIVIDASRGRKGDGFVTPWRILRQLACVIKDYMIIL